MIDTSAEPLDPAAIVNGNNEHASPATTASRASLDASCMGRWLVTTRGSRHLWDIRPDGVRYQRMPGDRAASFVADGTTVSELNDSTGPWLLVGLDGEMSSADIETGGRLIQAGAAVWSDEPGGPIETFTTLIRHDEMEWSDRAAQVHGITRDELDDAPAAADADVAMSTWLLDHGATAERRLLVPIGLNVAAFDMPFFRQALPTTASLFARRAVDLNALCFSYAGWDPNPRARAPRDFAGWKRSMKTAANRSLSASGVPVREHDAGYDAAQALIGWWWLREQLVTVTGQLGRAQADLDVADPMRAALGAGLLGRLNGVPRQVIEQIVAGLPDGKLARKWFGTVHPQLGCSPLAAIESGRLDEVVAIVSAKP